MTNFDLDLLMVFDKAERRLADDSEDTSEDIKCLWKAYKMLRDEIDTPMNFEVRYPESDLVSFGNYLLSEGRRADFKTNPNFTNEDSLEERLSKVNHADLYNWKGLNGK